MAVFGPNAVASDFAHVVARVRSKGLDPSKVISCVPSPGLPGAVPGVRGCNVYDRCPFHLTRYGGFKGDRPHRVGYYLKPEDGTRHQKEDEIDCNKFVALIYERMKAGIRDRENGMKGEIVNIIAQEGELIRIKHYVRKFPDNPKDETFKQIVIERPVSVFKNPDDLEADSYENELEKRAVERMRSDPDMQTGPPALPPQSMRMPLEGDEDEEFVMGVTVADDPAATAAPVSEPVKAERKK